jgi:hypothetical protein
VTQAAGRRPFSFSGITVIAMRRLPVAVAAIAAIIGARLVADAARDLRAGWPATATAPFAPSPEAAPFLSLGYREAVADLMWIRMLSYLGGTSDTADGVHALVETTLALDPYYRPGYDVGALAIQSASQGAGNAAHLAAISVLERGMKVFPQEWQYPFLAAQTYLAELIPADDAERRAWTEKGVLLMERAVRLPGAIERAAITAAHFQEKLGRHELAVKHLEEMILIAQSDDARNQLIAELARLQDRDAADLQIAMIEARRGFVEEWYATRPALPASMYILLGARRNPYLPPSALAVDRDLIGTNPPDFLEPLFDDAPAPAPAPATPDALPP